MIVVIDDQEMAIKFLVRSLEKLDSEILTATRAEEAKAIVGPRKPDLIICDIVMPEMDGFQFRKWYEESFPYRRTPFIFHTALNGIQDEIKGLNLGADDYLVKPIDAKLLQARVRAILRMRRRYLSTSFEGNLDEYPAQSILDFCQRNGLTGAVIFQKGQEECMWTFKSGLLLTSPNRTNEWVLKQLTGYEGGSFQILATPPSLDEIEKEKEAQRAPSKRGRKLPPGLLSGFQAGNSQIDIQTEIQEVPKSRVVSTVFANGQILKKFAIPLPPDWDFERMQKELKALHNQSEEETRERLRKSASRRVGESR